jgi:hypothetical protein
VSSATRTAAEVARRLLPGEGKPGAYTPAALFGPSLAQACGGEYLIDDLSRCPGLAEVQADDLDRRAGQVGGELDIVNEQYR